jgi:hypothetical protein
MDVRQKSECAAQFGVRSAHDHQTMNAPMNASDHFAFSPSEVAA